MHVPPNTTRASTGFALVFGVSVGGHGAVTALVLAACFAAVATVVSLTRQFDFVRGRRPEREPGATEPT